MDNYLITDQTLAIMPYSKGKSKIYEYNKIFIVDKSPKRIISLNCFYNGSSYNVRKKIAEKLTGNYYKVPMLLNNKDNIIMFPTESPRLNSCCWINYKNIKNYYESSNGMITIKFYDGSPIEINSSINIIKNQILKSNFLNFKVNDF